MKKVISMYSGNKHILILDCFSGISGDMTVGAFLDLGMDFNHLTRELKKLPVTGYTLTRRKVTRVGITGTSFTVRLKTHTTCTRFIDIKKMITRSRLSAYVKSESIKIFTLLARAEAYVHGCAIKSVRFHEIGAVDSIIDIVATALCLEYFNIDAVYVKDIHVGTGGHNKTIHGTYPIPAPATVHVLKGFPVTFTSISSELVTPTGAACIAALVDRQKTIPPCTIEGIGYGFGSTRIEKRPNALRLLLGRCTQTSMEEELMVLETNIDDIQPLVYEHIFEQLFRAGARDVYVTPIMMKKNRPAHLLSVLFDKNIQQQIVTVIFQETSTIGVRFYTVNRIVLPRVHITVKTQFGPVAVKMTERSNGAIKAFPEYDSCKNIAQRKNVPFLRVYTEAQYMAQQQGITRKTVHR